MDWTKIKVLVLDGASRQILSILKGLSDLGCYIATLSTSKLDNGYVSKYPDEKLIVPEKYYTGDYYSYIKALAETGKYDVLLPLSDKTMDLVTAHIDELQLYVRLPVPRRQVFLKAYNKQQTMEICMDNDIPCPITRREHETLDDAVKKIGFPLIAKPRMANGSQGLKIVKSRKQLDELIANKEVILDEYVIQEFIPQTGKQYNIHLFSDRNRDVVDRVVTEKSRWFPVDGGASCLCRTVKNKKVEDDCIKLLKEVDWLSYCEIEMIVDPRDGVAKVMEINGRASASIKIMELVGLNIAEQMLQLAYDMPITIPGKIEEDVRLRCIFTDLLWFAKSRNRFTGKPSWFSMKHTHDVMFSIRDPLPFFAYILKMGPNYRKEMAKRKRT